MAPLATAAELRTYLKLAEARLADDRAELILEGVSDAVRKYTRRTFDLAEDDALRVAGTGTPVLLLPELPVAVTAVVEDPDGVGTALDGPDGASPAWEWDPAGILWRTDGGVWAARARWYLVTYDHGAATVPAGVKLVVLRAAARAVGNPDDRGQETMAGYAATYNGAGELTEADRAALDDYSL